MAAHLRVPSVHRRIAHLSKVGGGEQEDVVVRRARIQREAIAVDTTPAAGTHQAAGSVGQCHGRARCIRQCAVRSTYHRTRNENSMPELPAEVLCGSPRARSRSH